MHLLWLPTALEERSHLKYNFQPAWASASILSARGASPPSQRMAGASALFQYQKKIPPLPVHCAYAPSPSVIVTTMFISFLALSTICNIPTYIFFFLQTVFCGSISCKRAALCGFVSYCVSRDLHNGQDTDVWSQYRILSEIAWTYICSSMYKLNVSATKKWLFFQYPIGKKKWL